MSMTKTTDTDDDSTEHIPLDDAGDVTLPVVEVLTGRAFLTGKSGAGKSNSASVIAEELLDRGFPLLVVDTDGEYWGLKEEYEILHVGADEECDLQVGAEHAGKLAELALDDNVPIILDVSGFLDADEGDALVRETARELFQREKKRKKPFLMLVEEIHEYIPEGGGLDDTGEMLIRVAKRGRKRGLGLAGMSQRPADVKKDFITQCDWLLWHRLTWENDTDVVRRVVGSKYADAVQDLEDGEAFLMADFLDTDIERVQVRRKRTFDAGATPDLDDSERPDLKSVSGDLVDELEQISEQEERRQDRIAQLEAELEAREERIADLEEELENARDMREMASQFADAMQSTGDSSVASEKVDELIDERNRLQSELEDAEARIEDLQTEVERLETELAQRPDISERAFEAVEVLTEEFELNGGESSKWKQKYQRAQERIEELETRQPSADDLDVDPMENRKVKRFVSRITERLNDLSETKQAMLRYYVTHGEAKASDAYKYAGNSPGSKRRRQYSNDLADAGFLTNEDGETYAYALRETVVSELGEHFTDEEVEAVVRVLEDRVDEVVMNSS